MWQAQLSFRVRATVITGITSGHITIQCQIKVLDPVRGSPLTLGVNLSAHLPGMPIAQDEYCVGPGTRGRMPRLHSNRYRSPSCEISPVFRQGGTVFCRFFLTPSLIARRGATPEGG